MKGQKVGGRELREYEELVGMINVHTAVIIDRIHPRFPKILIRDTSSPHSDDWEMSKESAVNFSKLVGPLFEEEDEFEEEQSVGRWLLTNGLFVTLFLAAGLVCVIAAAYR